MRALPLLACLLICPFTLAAAEAERLALWNGQAPVGMGASEPAPADAVITIHRAEHANGAALVICPGGGYGGRVSGPEGHGIAAWLNAHGIAGVVLDYRLPKGRPAVPLLDAQRAIRLTRAHAREWGIDAQRIGIIGFSAGGHLAASAATLHETGQADAADPVQRLSSRPDFAILVYPVISMQDGLVHGGSRANLLGASPAAELVQRFSSERQVGATTPPTYLAHAVDDKVVTIENSRSFAAAMRAAKQPVELLELPSGGHGLNGYKGAAWDAWQAGSLVWLAGLKFIPADAASAPH
jgi:acetyl esterase/lipase